MPKNLRFWTNVTLIALVHVVLIVGLIRLSRENKSAGAQSVVWLDGGAGDGMVTQKKNLPARVKSPLPRKELKTDELMERDSDEDRPYLASAPSDITANAEAFAETSTKCDAGTQSQAESDRESEDNAEAHT